MSISRHFPSLLLALVIGTLVASPQLIHMRDARYQGIPLKFNSDERSYQTHLQETLLGRYGQAGKGITLSGEDDPSFHLSPVEEVEGMLFGWTGLNAPEVFAVLDFVIPFLFILVLIAFLKSCGLSPMESLAAAALFGLLQLGNLNRPVNQRESVLLALFALLCVQYSRAGKWRWSILGGLLLGLLVGTNVWAWMLAWCIWGMLLLLLLLTREWNEARSLSRTGVIGLICASPFVWQILSIRSHPAYADTVERTGLIHWKMPESFPWSICFAVMTACTAVYWIRKGKPKADLSVVALIVSAFIVFNQQLLHGLTLMFRAHLLFFLAIAAISILIYNIRQLRQERGALGNRDITILCISTLAALTIVGALTYEGTKVITQWRVDDSDFKDQHFASLLPILNSLPRSIILSDPETSVFVSASTKHDVVFTGYLQHTLITHKDLAVAFCTTLLPLSPAERHLEPGNQLVIANGVGSELDPVKRRALEERDVALAKEACDRLDKDPAQALQDAGVQYILWDEAEQSDWDLDRLRVQRHLVGRGEGWSLWKVEYTLS